MRSSSERLARLRFEGGPAEVDSDDGPDGLGRVGAGSGAVGAEDCAGLWRGRVCQLWDDGGEEWVEPSELVCIPVLGGESSRTLIPV